MNKTRFWPGETARVRVQFTGESGAALAVTGVEFKARDPAGTVTTVDPEAVVNEGTGAYYADVPLATAGNWSVRATCSGPSAAAVEVGFAVVPSTVI